VTWRRAERGERDARALWLGPLMAVVCVLLVALAAAPS
jgi:hypothetical protein